MFHLNLNRQLFWIVALLTIFSNLLFNIYLYNENQKLIETRVLARATNLQTYFVSMRYVYHHQFLKSGLEIDDNTVGFLPAHASALISDRFSTLSKDGTTIRNVTDRPRNITNKADKFESEAIEYFKNNKNETSRLQKIINNGEETFFYTAPLKIEKYCLNCHGKKEEVLPYVAKRYNSAYDYEVGDIRGVTSIKIPTKAIEDDSMAIFYETVLISWVGLILLLILIYYVIKKLTLKDVETKLLLKKEVREKTADLQEQTLQLQASHIKQEHLFSILRTVADCNQILITAKSVDELIEKTALSMHSNRSFDSVRISIFDGNDLKVKTSIGLDQDNEIYPLEREVYRDNRYVFLKHFDENMPKECLERIKKYHITEVYSLPLRRDHHAKEALGVMTICTTDVDGLNKEEQDMINELAGDIGFAMNSFFQQEAINKLSYYDTLTNLPNQKLFLEHLTQTLQDSRASLMYGAVLFIDFDNFKSINDIKGKEAGDSILKEMAYRLISNIYEASMISRYGGDKFLILLEGIDATQDRAALFAKKIAQKILDVTNEHFIINEQPFYLTIGIGIVLFHNDKISSDELLNRSENAMHMAKKDGKNMISFYDPLIQEVTNTRSKMIQSLKEGLLNNQFFVLYQKQFDQDENVIGVEALLRWQHPEFGMVSPAQFIPLAEESGFIIELGNFVLQESIKELKSWRDDDAKSRWRVSVNVSPIQFKKENFVNILSDMLFHAQIEPNKIRVELTEGILIDNKKEAMQKVQALKEIGVTISIDDFGTGYSSLAYLRHLQIHELKIDQSFVFALSDNDADKTIIKTIIMMGDEFGFDIIAEGVETKEQYEELKKLGCLYFQGYLFAKACEPKQL